jgi:hypothetical protein
MSKLVKVNYKYHDDAKVYEGYIGVAISEEYKDLPSFDDGVFYYVDSDEELEALYNSTDEDFILLDKPIKFVL